MLSIKVLAIALTTVLGAALPGAAQFAPTTTANAFGSSASGSVSGFPSGSVSVGGFATPAGSSAFGSVTSPASTFNSSSSFGTVSAPAFIAPTFTPFSSSFASPTFSSGFTSNFR